MKLCEIHREKKTVLMVSTNTAIFSLALVILPQGIFFNKTSAQAKELAFGTVWDVDHHTHGWKARDKSQIRRGQLENSD